MTTPDPKGDDGFTLVELLISCVLLGIILTVVGSLLVSLITTPKSVTARIDTSNAAQLVLRSIDNGVRNSSDFRLTSPQGNDQLLVARTAQSGATIAWVCSAWYYSATDGSIRSTVSTTTIATAPDAATVAGWTLLDSGVTPSSGTGIFTVVGQQLLVSFNDVPAGQSSPQTMTTSVYSRAGSTGSPQCY
ncbi:type II secretion system protein J [Lysinimonas soli]|uniref:Type II secretion system protein J n=1 Tax=Lysinimonas soli TaxID=1074233 RepID=A0ABW0NT01_9MICO